MEAVAAAGLFLVGLVLMIRGGGLFVEASVDLAEAWGVPISGRTLGLDLPVCLGLCVLATVPPLLTGRYRRWQGALLLGLYGAYLAVLAGK